MIGHVWAPSFTHWFKHLATVACMPHIPGNYPTHCTIFKHSATHVKLHHVLPMLSNASMRHSLCLVIFTNCFDKQAGAAACLPTALPVMPPLIFSILYMPAPCSITGLHVYNIMYTKLCSLKWRTTTQNKIKEAMKYCPKTEAVMICGLEVGPKCRIRLK
ncbi:hypothetical protein CRENBAI_000919 [Crenichthys baileyi]|uniref:Uncharacterized protein n=1 Tax=Crenichthys baileyi TaxID=28760 RepID=A0AAV9RH72_9TELE